MSFAVQRVNPAEIPACVSVIRESFRTVADEFGITPENAPRFTAFAVTEERLRYHDTVEHRPMFAAHDGERIVGYVSLVCHEEGTCELGNLAVLPSYRHRGIGRALLEAAEEEARERGYSRMTLSLVDENTRLREWYESLGFKRTNSVKYDFFPFTCGYMEKELKPFQIKQEAVT